MHVTMVKKRLANGEACDKCAQTEALLKNRGLWGEIDEIIWAVEGEPDSEGMRLGREHGIEAVPFFVVSDDEGQQLVYESALKFVRAHFPLQRPSVAAGSLDPDEIEKLASEFEGKEPQDMVRWALERYGAECAIAFSGAEDVGLIDMAAKSGYEYSVFCLDTGRLHAETYKFVDDVRRHYGIEIRMMAPDPVKLEPFVQAKGLFSFYDDGHQECCKIRKVQPLRRALKGYRAWIAGQRKDQSPATRAEVPLVQIDSAFEGSDGSLLKLNPLASWSSKRLWTYIRSNKVPFNPLHERGFISIGCEPCTRPTHPGQHEREGRWWWEEATQKECGLHSDEPESYSI